ncbi:MAG: acyltransferase [Acidobacteria bacterium]|nr:acyltransferase [Acidobacteriota bacterium]MBS1866148.1 acyltransferase [Acidobacteriota bacterium]
MPELDSLRGIAILAVVFYHGFFWSNNLVGLSGLARRFVALTSYGWLGVHLFFVLSGFLITGILEDSKAAPHYFKRFYWRRALRILPAFYATLVVLFFIPGQNKAYLLLSFSYLSNLAPIFHIRDTYPMFWSLAAEEHFYLVWPLLVRFMSRRALLLVASLLFLISPVLRALAFRDPLPAGFGGFTWLVADGFAGGAILALLVRDPWCSRKKLAVLCASSLAISIAFLPIGARYGVLTHKNLIGAAFLLTAAHLLFTGSLALLLLFGTSKWKSFVNYRLLSFYGDISYGLYLIHWIVFMCYDAIMRFYAPEWAQFVGNIRLLSLRFLMVMAAATLVAWISRKFFEERSLRLKTLFP